MLSVSRWTTFVIRTPFFRVQEEVEAQRRIALDVQTIFSDDRTKDSSTMIEGGLYVYINCINVDYTICPDKAKAFFYLLFTSSQIPKMRHRISCHTTRVNSTLGHVYTVTPGSYIVLISVYRIIFPCLLCQLTSS